MFFVSSLGLRGDELLATDGSGQAAGDVLRRQNAALREEVEQQAATIRVLTENLAIARTESELFQRRWAEAQLRAQTLGVDLADADLKNLQRQVIDSIRSLYVAEAERHRLLKQLEELIAAFESGAGLTATVERAKQVLASSAGAGTIAAAEPNAAASLESARVIEVNAALRVVVVNVGSDQGARVGMPLLVLRGDRVVAELRVIEVRRRICGALIESQDRDAALKAGDEVRVTKS